MTEDEIYRTTTQYRLWSYTRETLASMRAATNSLASTRVESAIRRSSAQNSTDGAEAAPRTVDCLTVEEEQKLINFYCIQAIRLSDFCDFPTFIKATAVQYLKRFYLSNSPMTYHPKQLMKAAVFLATKTDNNYISLRAFAAKFPKTTEEDVVAPEFLLTQGLRFTFDVRHPHRGMEGGYMELIALAAGVYHPPPGIEKSGRALQEEMLQLPKSSDGRSTAKSIADVKIRIQQAYGKAKDILKTSALLTDAYFLYTPSQIWLAALLVADERLALFYLDCKIPSGSMLTQILDTLGACAQLLSSSISIEPEGEEMNELKRIDKKLYTCRNPEKIDLIGLNKAQKRDGEDKGEGGLDEKTIKKRKLEREISMQEADSVFGPSLTK